MSDLYSVIPGLQPTAQELLEGELLCKQILEAKFPDLDLREGTGLRDLVLRPSAMLFALMKKASDYYFTQNTLNNINDVTPPEVLDSILSNWFLTRNIGIKSVISARLYFARKKNTSISSDVYFSTDNIYKFYPSESASYNAESMIFDSYSNEYYIDVDLNAEREGSRYNISSGSLLYFSNFDPYFLRAEINYLKSESINSETNSEFISRSKSAISTRNLINIPSIDSNLRSQFNYVNKLLTVGMGDPEMIRDQIKVILDPPAPRTVVSVTRVGTTVTVNLPDHGYNSGQRVKIEGADPDPYNGVFTITVLNNSVFTYTIVAAPGPMLSPPSVSEVNDPVLIHNGGMVDVYCSDKLATSLIQLTTDEFGRVDMTGPVYEFKRSSISAGDYLDTLPLTVEKDVTTITVAGTLATVTTLMPHTYVTTDIITISGANQDRALSSLVSTGITATATLTGHSYQVGNKVIITGATPSGYNGTFTIIAITANTFDFLIPSPINSSAFGAVKASVNLVNGPKQINVLTPTTFTFPIAQTTPIPVTGTSIKASLDVKYTTTNPTLGNKNLDLIHAEGTEVTVNLAHHGYNQGRHVKITGCSVAAFNGTWFIKEVLNKDQFIFDIPSWINNTSATGVVTAVIPYMDFGFSQKQILNLDFGVAYANRTVTFEIKYFQNLDSIQNYLESSANRVLCADYLAKGFNFYKISVDVTSYNGIIPDATKVEEIIKGYLDSLALSDMFIMSDMVSRLRLNGITNIQNPPKVTYKKYTRDLIPVETGTITDIMDTNDRTSVFLLDTVSTFAQTITTNNTAFTI